jgi:hypothetical protein
MSTMSECRYRWLRLPATTFVITRSPSRFSLRDGLEFLEWETPGPFHVRIVSGAPGLWRVVASNRPPVI